MSKYLFFSQDGKLGDAIAHSAFVAEINRRDPYAIIDVTAAGFTIDFWGHDPRVRRVIDLNKPNWLEVLKLGLSLRSEHYDYVVAWNHHKSEKIKMFVKLMSPSCYIEATEVAGRHILERERRALQKIFNDVANVKYSLPLIPQSDQPNGLLINLFSGVWEWKRTIKQKHALEFISKIRHQLPHLPITLCSEAHTFAYANEIRGQLLADKILIKVVDASQEGYMGLLKLCASAKLILSPDTAVVHLASALNKPIVGIYQNDGVKSILWAPTSRLQKIILSQSTDSIEGFDVDEVVRSIIELNERVKDA